jgi:hypothetical protein
MNRFFLLIVSLTGITTSQLLAQHTLDNRQTDWLGKGTVQAGVGVSGSYQYSSGLTSHFVPRLQYFVKKGWSVGVEGRYQTNGKQSQYVGVGPSTRYYFVRFKRLDVFGQAGATVGRNRYRTYSTEGIDPLLSSANRREQKSKAWQATAGLGVNFRASNRWSLEAAAERALLTTKGMTNTNSRWQGSVGVNYRLKRK